MMDPGRPVAVGCPAGTSRHCDPRVKECHADACRGKIVPLLLKMCQAVSEPDDLSLALESLLDYMHSDMGVERAMVNLHDRETGCIFIHKCLGLTEEEQARGVYFPGEGITGQVDDLAKPILVPRIGDEPAFLNRTKSFTREQDRDQAFLCVPILRGKKVLGSISAIRAFDDQELMRRRLGALAVAANMLAQAVELYLLEHVDKVRWERRQQDLLGELRARFKPANIIGTSKTMMEVFGLMHKVAQTRTTVLLLGESGVGKEMIADALHFEGSNPSGPMVKVNCAALPENILESELFGHEKGSFTGADKLRKGRFEEADGGTLFLDEVGELPLGTQAKLLRVLQERSFERVGGNRTVTVNVRIVAATNRDLAAMVEQGSFRQDLYFRLNVFPLIIPPLRERGSDILTLAEHFLARFARETEKRVTRISTPALNLLMTHFWPGNVRELENAIERAVILTEDDAVHSYNLPPTLQPAVLPGENKLTGLDARLGTIEREMLVEALGKHQGNASKAAVELGLTYRSMGIRMRKHDLRYSSFRKGTHADAASSQS